MQPRHLKMIETDYEPEERIRRDAYTTFRNPRAPQGARLRAVAEIEKARRAGKAVRFRLAREYDQDELIEAGWNHQRSNTIGPFPSQEACLWSDLQRWSVNFIRHEETNYEHRLMRGVGLHAAAHNIEVKRRVLQTIAKTYPELEAECRRQMRHADRQARQSLAA